MTDKNRADILFYGKVRTETLECSVEILPTIDAVLRDYVKNADIEIERCYSADMYSAADLIEQSKEIISKLYWKLMKEARRNVQISD